MTIHQGGDENRVGKGKKRQSQQQAKNNIKKEQSQQQAKKKNQKRAKPTAGKKKEHSWSGRTRSIARGARDCTHEKSGLHPELYQRVATD